MSCKNQGPEGKSSNVKSESKDCNVDLTAKHSTNPNVVELRDKMIAFRNSLSKDLLNQASNCLDSERFYLWHNTPANKRGKRDGITYADLTADQVVQFKSLMQLFLSADGYRKVNEITVLAEGWLNEIKSEIWNPNFYSIDMFGDPNKTGSWGFQLDGHHCVVNFLVQGDNVSIVPAFLGGEPAKQTYKDHSFDIFKDERDLALKLFNSLNSDEKRSAVNKSSERALKVGAAKRPGNPDPYIKDYDYSQFKTGLQYSEMNEASKQNLIILMKEYVYNLNHTFADIWWADISRNLDDTFFVWIDNDEQPNISSQFYYRIYNPYLWLEFNTENVTGANSNNIEDWNHIHTITRIPNNPETANGGDYGVFASVINQDGPTTLYEHYANADHHKMSEFIFDYEVELIGKHKH